MNSYFEIYGTRIKYEDIKSFRIEQKEYIYRPTYKEKDTGLLKAFSKMKYEFYTMQPYAAILDENEWKSALKGYRPLGFAEAVGKDLVGGVVVAVGDKLRLKAIRSKQYVCRNQAGRIFKTYLEDIPALLIRSDGKFSDVRKDDELYPLLGEPIAPAINIIHALTIKADEDYIFYGNGVQIEDIGKEYERIKIEMDLYEEHKGTPVIEQKHIGLPQLPKVGLFKKEKGTLQTQKSNNANKEK